MEDNKKCTTIWLRPSVIRRMDAWMEEANCRSRSEFICLDNDAAGHAASERMGKLLEERGISAERLVPQQKDWNDDLKAEQENKMERSELCQTFC